MVHAAPPKPAALRHLKAADATGLAYAGSAAAATSLGIWLSALGPLWAWGAGQLLLGAALVQWFALLHECGHRTLFSHPAANVITGHVAGTLTLIPFDIWMHVHQQHHRWTGWQDLDPTTATLAPRQRNALERRTVAICWKLWIPLFAGAYRAGNFWNPVRLARVEPGRRRVRLAVGAVLTLGLYASLGWWFGLVALARIAGVATLLSFVVEDMLILSQHTHVPMELSHGARVTPHRAVEQERFTRSLRLPDAVSRMLVHIDAHELHHMYPFVPGYRLREIAYRPQREVGWWQWVRAARAIPGDVLLFRNSRETALDL